MQVGVPKDRVLLRLPATWEGIEATRALEADGCRCLVHMVFSFAQARAAAEAGASVIQARAPAPRTPWVALADPSPLFPLTYPSHVSFPAVLYAVLHKKGACRCRCVLLGLQLPDF